MSTEKFIYHCGKTFPSSLQGIGYILIFFIGLIIFYQKLSAITNPAVWIFLAYILMVSFSRSYIEVIDNESGKFRKYTRLFFIKIGKTKRINNYKYGIYKVLRQVYALPNGHLPLGNRDSEFALKVAKLWFTEKKSNNKELIFSGKKEEMQRFISNFVNYHKFPLYLGHYKQGNRVN